MKYNLLNIKAIDWPQHAKDSEIQVWGPDMYAISFQ